MMNKDMAVCIRTVDYSETSQIVTFFARDTGKLSLIAKGAKRKNSPFGGPLEIFSYGGIFFTESGREKLGTLTEFEPAGGIVNASVLAGNLYTMHCCLFAVELINLLTKDYDAHPGLFDGLVGFLDNAGRRKIPGDENGYILKLLISFQLILLKEIGLYPVFDYCVNCRSSFKNNWPQVFFSVNSRGLICRDCQNAFPDKIQIKHKTLNGLVDVKSIDSADFVIQIEVEDLLVHYFADILGRAPRMAKYVVK